MSFADWPDPPDYEVVAPKTVGATLGTIALVLVLAGPILMTLALTFTLAVGALFPLPLYLAAALTVPAVLSGVVVAVVAAWRHSGRWRAVGAMAASLPVGALALSFSLPIIDWLGM